MKKYILLLIVIFIGSNSLATEQHLDSLVYNGKGYYIEKQLEFVFENELRDFVERKNLLPEDFFYTSLWRRYIAVFEIKDNRLSLKELNALVYNEKDSVAYFQNIITVELQEKIKSMEFNGVLILKDEIDDYSFFNPDKIYNPNYKILELKKSILTKELDFKYDDVEAFKATQFEKYKKTQPYQKELKECKIKKKEWRKDYKRNGQKEMMRHTKKSDCSDFIKAFLFERSLYNHIL